MMLSFTLVLVSIALMSSQSSKVKGQRPPWTPEKEQAIEDFIAATWECRQIVGLSFAVVYDGEVRMTRGYGYEDIEQDRLADDYSPFCIGSLTKAFTSTMWGIIMDESDGEFTWDTLVKDVMGEDFKLSEEVRTERATVRDLLAHKMALANYGGVWNIGLPEGPSRQEYCSRLQFLEPHTGLDFRQQYAYNNFMYMLSSCMAEKITGMEYEQIIQEKILDRLGMDGSLYISAIQDDKEHVPTQYVWNYKTETMDRLDPDLLFATIPPSEASGGMCSPAVDMAQWMLMQLGEGSLHESQILDSAIWQDTHTPESSIRDSGYHRKPFFPAKLETPNYGLGWEVGDYREYRMAAHSGLVGSFNSILSLSPDMELAIFTSTNGPMGTFEFQQALHVYTADVVLEEPLWLNDTTGCTYPFPWAAGVPVQSMQQDMADQPEMEDQSGMARQEVGSEEEVAEVSEEEVVEVSEEEVAEVSWLRQVHQRYVGFYGHLLLGNFSIYYNETEDILWGSMGKIGVGQLLPVEGSEELFRVELWGALWHIPELGSPPTNYPLMRFTDLLTGEYQEIVAIGIDSLTPPVFVRGLQWDDLPEDGQQQTSQTSSAGTGGENTGDTGT